MKTYRSVPRPFTRRMPLAAVALCAGTPLALASGSDPALVCPDGTTNVSTPVFDRPTPVQRLMQAAGALRGNCPELVDLNGVNDGDHPFEIAFLNDGVTAVIVNRDSNNVTYLDTSTRTITGATPVGDYPVHVTVTPNGQYILTANVLSNTVSVIDAATRTVVATVPVTGNQPYRVEVTPDGQYAVVGVINNASDATFSVINLATFTEIRSFPGGSQGVVGGYANSVFPISGETFTQFAIAPDNSTIVLPSSGNPNSTIYLFDLNTGAQLAAISAPPGARSVDIHGTEAAVGFIGNANQIQIVDLTTQSVIQTIPTNTSLDPVLRYTADGSRLITGYLNDTFIIDRATGAEIFRTMTGTVGDIEITADGNYAVVSNFTTRLIDVNNPAVVAEMSFAATADLAVSPVSPVAAGLNNRFGEDVHVYSTTGPTSAFLGWSLTGASPEGDAPFDVDISADGSTAIIGMTLSYNVAIVDVPSRTVRAFVPTGKRVMDVAITPNGAYAVSCNGDSDTITIIDLATDTAVATLPIAGRPGRVVISPDSTTAYVLNIAGTDYIHFVNIAGASSSILGSVPCGQTGAWNSPQYSETSAITLSPDGSLLAVCDSFNDFVLLFDTSTRTQIAAVPTGDFPIRAAFNPAGNRLYVTNAFSGDVTVIDVAGAGSSFLASIPVGASPLTVDVDATGSYVYVTNYNFSGGSQLFVIDTASNSVVSTIPLTDLLARDAYLDRASGTLYVACNRRTATSTPPTLFRIAAAGPATSIIDATPLSSNGYDLEFSPAAGVAIFSQPFVDGADFICFGVPCRADWDGSGSVNSADISAFLSSWLDSLNNGDLNADFDNSGTVNSADISAFLNQWLADLSSGNC